MACFELLPAELQIEIFGRLQRPDVKAARAVSRKFRDHASPALFRSVVVCARYQAMGAFQNISLHPVYSTYIKEIIFDSLAYDEALAHSEQANSYAQDNCPDLSDGSLWQKRIRWKKYQLLFEEQEKMNVSGVLLQTIARGLEWMPNISSIIYSAHPHHIPVERKDMRDVLPRGSTTAHDASGFPLNHGQSQDPAFRQLIGAIFVSKYNGVHQLIVEPTRKGKTGNEFSLNILDFPHVDDLRAGRFLFQHLLKLELNMSLGDSTSNRWDPTRGPRQLGNLGKLLFSAKDLRHLALHMTRWKCSASLMYGHIFSDERSLFSDLGLRTTWPKLRSLSLEGLYAEEREVTDLIKRHRNTLRSLAFRKCSLSSGVWVEVVDEVVFNYMIKSFVLDRVNEVIWKGESWMSRSTEEKENWRYEGQLVETKDGERGFTDTNPDKQSVYALRQH